jgi:hypothetical protein
MVSGATSSVRATSATSTRPASLAVVTIQRRRSTAYMRHHPPGYARSGPPTTGPITYL